MAARRNSAKARDRALLRLRDLHPQEYVLIYIEELIALEEGERA